MISGAETSITRPFNGGQNHTNNAQIYNKTSVYSPVPINNWIFPAQEQAEILEANISKIETQAGYGQQKVRRELDINRGQSQIFNHTPITSRQTIGNPLPDLSENVSQIRNTQGLQQQGNGHLGGHLGKLGVIKPMHY